jgi:hypothetical protein
MLYLNSRRRIYYRLFMTSSFELKAFLLLRVCLFLLHRETSQFIISSNLPGEEASLTRRSPCRKRWKMVNNRLIFLDENLINKFSFFSLLERNLFATQKLSPLSCRCPGAFCALELMGGFRFISNTNIVKWKQLEITYSTELRGSWSEESIMES